MDILRQRTFQTILARSFVGAAWIVIALLGTTASAQVPLGIDQQVNTVTVLDQAGAAVAGRTDGSYVVVWQTGDTATRDIAGQLFDANGQEVGVEFVINAYTTASQASAGVAMAADGSFMVVWDSLGSASGDNDGLGILGRRFSSSGQALGDELQVNSYTTAFQREPSIAASGLGTFVVAWTSGASPGSDSSNYSVVARRFDASGSPVSPDFQVNTYTSNAQMQAVVDVAADGDFVVAWRSRGSTGSDIVGDSIQMRRFASDGTPRGSDVQVNTTTGGDQDDPAVAMLPDETLAVVWQSETSSGNDNDVTSIQARSFSSDGQGQGNDHQVNAATVSAQLAPTVTAASNDAFVVTWTSIDTFGSDLDGSIQAGVITSLAVPVGNEVQVNDFTTMVQISSAITSAGDGMMVVVWESEASPGNDSDGRSIIARRVALTSIFASGFETGDTSDWSSQVSP